MDITEEPRALDRSSNQSLDNTEQSTLQDRTVSKILESGNETLSLLSHTSNKDELISIPEDDPNASFLASAADHKFTKPKNARDKSIWTAAADQHKFTKRASVNATLCDLCRECIGDIITGDCVFKAASERSSRWTYERPPEALSFALLLSFRFYEGIKSVETSALRGCSLCRMISQGPWQLGSRQMYISVTLLRGDTSLRANLPTVKNTTKELWMINSWMHGWSYYQGFLPVVQDVDRQVTDLNPQEWYFHNTGSDKVMNTIRIWKSECLEKHPLCARKTPFSLPTRVIDVGRADSSDDPYLLESGGRAAPYIALSYCWGSGKKFVSTRNSIAKRRERFMLAELPKTLRDAVLVTRRLGVRYLWVDALCIVQDDDTDWQSESSNMRAIYRNTSFVISALDASHSDSGMFYDRTALIASSDDPSATHTNLYVREDERDQQWSTYYQQNSLGERAWALQERFMATALLHFSRRRLYWECRTCNLFEDGERRDSHPISKDFGRSTDVKQPTDERDWYHLVSLYLKRQLTHTSDKLAAIAGLATEFEEQGWCRGYLVGLWQSDIVRGLLWHINDPDDDFKDAVQFAKQFAKLEINPQFPSWSWASSDRHHDWDQIRSELRRYRTPYDIDVEGMRVELSEENKAAKAVKGSLTFKAFMILLSHDELVLPEIQPWHLDLIFRKAKHLSPYWQRYLNVPTKRPCWLARMATWIAWLAPQRQFVFETFFLLLEEAPDENVFRRVGIYKRYHDDPDEQLTIHDMVRREITII